MQVFCHVLQIMQFYAELEIKYAESAIFEGKMLFMITIMCILNNQYYSIK